jgi:hypothetical protein
VKTILHQQNLQLNPSALLRKSKKHERGSQQHIQEIPDEGKTQIPFSIRQEVFVKGVPQKVGFPFKFVEK